MLKRFIINFSPLFLILSLKSRSKSHLAEALLNLRRYLNASVAVEITIVVPRTDC